MLKPLKEKKYIPKKSSVRIGCYWEEYELDIKEFVTHLMDLILFSCFFKFATNINK